MPRPRNSEVRSYQFILEELEARGYNPNNPATNQTGEVYTQEECLSDARVAQQLGRMHPENIIKLSTNEFYVIEAKSEREEIDLALKEAKEDYADKINQSRTVKAKIISGVAGNNTDSIVKNMFFENGRWKTIKVNGIELLGLVSKKIAKLLLENDSAEIENLPIDEKELLAGAENINQIMHEGAIEKSQRAKVISAILLSMIDDPPINLNENIETLSTLIGTRVSQVLRREGKPDFHRFVSLDLPSSPENHIKFRTAIIETYHELYRLDIRSAMKSGTDILGKFYEVFLKYGNGAKEIGIVLTPRHITKFACDVVNVNKTDLVYDPCCGTAGFLVSAFDKVKREASASDIDTFKEHNLFGVEEQDPVIALAIVNMIFRGDGKTNIIEGNCFSKWLTTSVSDDGKSTARYLREDENIEERVAPITKVLMNPPFSQPKSTNKEFRFVEQALKQMENGGILFSILPSPAMVKQGKYRNWRRNSLLRENTLLSVITFPDDLFYPVGAVTCGIIVKKGIPHPTSQKVLWVKIRNDGLLKSKGKRLPNERATNELTQLVPLIKSFVKNPTSTSVENKKESQISMPIEMSDENLELLPEVYLDEEKPTEAMLENAVEETLREAISFMILGNKLEDFRKEVLTSKLFDSKRKPPSTPTWKEIPIQELLAKEPYTGEYHVSGILDEGVTPLISCSTFNNGAEGYFQIPTEHILKNAITIASDGAPLTSFYHYYGFTAKDNVIIAIPKEEFHFTTRLFFTTQLNSLKWRFSYGRKCYLNKIHKIRIFLPFKGEEIDEEYIEWLFKKSASWETLKRLF